MSFDVLGEGDYCTAVLLDGTTVLRVAKHDIAAASLRREACLLPRIADRFELRIPQPTLVERPGAPIAARHAFLPGPALTRARYEQLGERARGRCAGQLADFLRALHTTDLALARECGIGEMSYRFCFDGILERARHHLFPVIERDVRDFIRRTIADGVGAGAWPAATALLHGDLSPDHVLLDDGTEAVTGIIDFGDAVIGDPARDFIYLYEDYGLDLFARVASQYAPADARAIAVRAYRHYVLAGIEWAVWCAEGTRDGLAEAVRGLAQLSTSEAADLDEIRHAISLGRAAR